VSKFLAGIAAEGKNTREDMMQHAKEAGRVWKSFSDAEKKVRLTKPPIQMPLLTEVYSVIAIHRRV
jgi:hypothetical protein